MQNRFHIVIFGLAYFSQYNFFLKHIISNYLYVIIGHVAYGKRVTYYITSIIVLLPEYKIYYIFSKRQN